MYHYTLFSFNAPSSVLSWDPSQPTGFPPPFTPFCFLSFVDVCVGWVHEYVSIHTCGGWSRMSVAPYFPHSLSVLLVWDRVSWQTGSPLFWAGQPASSWNLPVFAHHAPMMEIQAGVAMPPGLLCGCWRVKLWSSCLQIQLTKWILSSTFTFCFLLVVYHYPSASHFSQDHLLSTSQQNDHETSLPRG